MANLKEQEKWEDGVYQIEENDPVLGGEDGITNKPIKQLANRTLWLKKALELFGKKSAPKDLVADSTSTADESGHSHKLPVGSTTQKGIWQATSDTGVDSDGLVLTAKAGKKLAQLIATVQLALNNYIPLNKRSSAVNSNDENNVATSKAVKTANDNANSRVAKSGDTMTGNLTVPNLIVNDPTNNNNFVQIGDDTKLIDVDIGHTVGLQTPDNANDAYIAYGATKKRFGFDGANFSAESGLGAQWFGSQKRGEGAYASQWQTTAPYYVNAGNANGSNTYFPYLKGKVTNGDGWGSAFSFGYTTPGARNQFGTGIIHLIEDNGREKWWEFAHNGNFRSAGDVITGAGRSLNSAIYRDGNPHDIALSWQRDGLKVRVDVTDLGRVAFQQDIHTALRGAVCAFAMSHPPAGWLKCNGAAVSRTAYADLFSIIGTHYGAGDGHSTFNLPDLRGEFIRGIDEGRGADPNRAFGSWQSDEIRSHNHFIQFDGVAAGRRGAAEGAIHSGSGKPYYTDHTGGNETRPRNVALLYCIKY